MSDGTDRRVPSFDGVPLDADVALPATGRGPFPLIVMLHGLGQDKTSWEVSSNDGSIDDVTMASRGYAVLMYTARGFGNSCGTARSRAGTPACDAGWIHLADQRYEIRDTQYLAGLLVDEGLVRPQIAVTGVSYGAGQTLELAALKNRIRLTDGRFAPWVSPVHHVPMSVAAAYAQWPWDDLVTALAPNGGLLTSRLTPASADAVPPGVEKQSWNTLLYGVTTKYFLAPPGQDPGADLTDWYNAISMGEPISATDTAALTELQTYHSAIGIPLESAGVPALAIQNGWTDTLFPVSEALHFTESLTAAHIHDPLLLIFDDYGHGWAQAKPADITRQNAAVLQFLDTVMLHHGVPPTKVLAVGQTCPASAPSSPVLTASSWSALATGTLTLSSASAQTVTSAGGSPAVAAALNPAYASKLCDPLPAGREPGTAVASLPVTHATTLIGAIQIHAHLQVVGNYPELVGRLWDVGPSGQTRQIVETGIVRPDVDQSAQTTAQTTAATDVTFELAPNEYTVAAGHTLELELVGSTAPWFRKSNGTFSMTVTDLHATISTH
jgi:pimeloyl-ACP methyl ester carboxylesterase